MPSDLENGVNAGEKRYLPDGGTGATIFAHRLRISSNDALLTDSWCTRNTARLSKTRW